MSKFLVLWDALQTTDPAYAKDFNKAGFKGTAINPCYVAKKLTETFGPCGVGWRFVLDDEKYVEGHRDLNTGVVLAIIHVVRGHLEYKHAGEWVGTSPQFGQTTFVGTNKHGAFTDEEAPKKSITDCLSKCAVSIGLSADIHLGLWDANKYVNDGSAGPPAAASRTAPQRPAPAPPVEPAQRIKSPVWVDLEHAPDPSALLNVFEKASRTAALTSDAATWEEVLVAVSTAWRRINLPDDPSSKKLLGALQAERGKLDGVSPNEGAEQQTSGTVPKPRTRKKSVPS